MAQYVLEATFTADVSLEIEADSVDDAIAEATDIFERMTLEADRDCMLEVGNSEFDGPRVLLATDRARQRIAQYLKDAAQALEAGDFDAIRTWASWAHTEASAAWRYERDEKAKAAGR